MTYYVLWYACPDAPKPPAEDTRMPLPHDAALTEGGDPALIAKVRRRLEAEFANTPCDCGAVIIDRTTEICPHKRIVGDEDAGTLECASCGVVIAHGYNPEVDRVGHAMDIACARAVEHFERTGQPLQRVGVEAEE